MKFEDAKKLLNRGFALIPLHTMEQTTGKCTCGHSECRIGGEKEGSVAKHPRINAWQKNWTRDEKVVKKWFEEYGDTNIGIVTGQPSGNIFVIDVDVKNGDGIKNFTEKIDKKFKLHAEHKTLIVKTGSGGYHIFYKYNEVEKIGNRTNIVGSVDIRGDGGYVVAPASLYRNGEFYKIEQDLPIADAPPELELFLQQRSTAKSTASDTQGQTLDLPTNIPQGQRNDVLFKAACSLRAKGFPEETIETSILSLNKTACNPALSDDEVIQIVRSSTKYNSGELVKKEIVDAENFDVDALTKETIISQATADVYGNINTHVEKSQMRMRLTDKAKALGVSREFERFIKKYDTIRIDNIENKSFKYPDKLILDCGDWVMSESGVFKLTMDGKRIEACSHPIIISRRMQNLDTRDEKVEIKFKRGFKWHSLIVDKLTISDRRKLVELSNKGIAVNTENAKHMVEFFADIDNLNYETIPVIDSITRLGYIDDKRFVPYVKNIQFDGEMYFKPMFDAVSSAGSEAKWLDIAAQAMENPIVRLTMATSMASPLIKKLNRQIFFTHLWGGTEVGKTVALSLAMSVWGNPKELVRTHNSTLVGLERMAGFFKNIPLALDELQTVKDKFHSSDKMIYQLASGISKGRGNKNGGIDAGESWANTVISTGEEPMTDDKSGGGAKNRSLEIYCKDKIFKEPGTLMDVINENYGMAGEKLINEYSKYEFEELNRKLKARLKHFTAYRFTDKQRASIAVLAVADEIFQRTFLGKTETEAVMEFDTMIHDNIKMFAQTTDIMLADRAYDEILSWIATNHTKLQKDSTFYNEVYGEILPDQSACYIVVGVFKDFISQKYNYDSVTRELVNKGILLTHKGETTVTRRVRTGGTGVRCVKIKLIKEALDIDEIDDEETAMIEQMFPEETQSLPYKD